MSKKNIVFATPIANILVPFLDKVIEQDKEQWKWFTFNKEDPKVKLTVSRANRLTNAYPARKQEEGVSRSRKNVNAYFYVMVLRSIVFNHHDRTYWIGTDKIWRLDGESQTPVEIDEQEMQTLETHVKDALTATDISCECFRPRSKSAKEATEETEEEGDEPAEEEGEEDYIVSDAEEEGEEEEEEGEEPPYKRARTDDPAWVALKESIDQSSALSQKMMELLTVQSEAIRLLLVKNI